MDIAFSSFADDERSLDQLVEKTAAEYERTTSALKEIDGLIRHSSAEVQSLAQRNARVSNHLRQLQLNFDTIPREDIKEGYEALISAQQRLFTMRGQLEKLQSDQQNLQRLADLQRLFLDVTRDMTDLPELPHAALDQPGIVRVIQSEEATRQTLVRRMHDGPASSLSNFILQAEICQRLFDIDPDRARDELDALKQSASATFSAVKNFIFDLRPMMLDDLGVVPTLRRYVEAFEERQGISVSLAATGTVRRLEEHIEVTLFRGVQELMNNARRHGRATEIHISMEMADESVEVLVEDNGSGFNVDEVLAAGRSEGIGLSTLRERLELMGGELTMESRLGEGSRIGFTIPVADEPVSF
jgi:two-component system, NarL family, sensor histidine kinase DegS